MVTIQENVLLKDLTTFQIGGPAKYFLIAKNETDLREGIAFAKTRHLPVSVLGGGSNLLVSDNGFPGLVIKTEIKGVKIIDQGKDKAIIEVGAGENWDELVALTVARNLYGLENLSGIPGTVGGAAVQNAGAYGVEIKDCLISVQAVNLKNSKSVTFSLDDCEYSYRDSLFKKSKKYVITLVTLELSKKEEFNLEYAGLKKVLGEGKINLNKVREAVLAIRASKLPDWHKVGTAGSFFKNPIITEKKYSQLISEYPDLPHFPVKLGFVKVPLAWILDNICHLKGYKSGYAATHTNQPLVLINTGGATSSEIENLSNQIKKTVYEKTGIKIEEEVEKI